MLEQSFFTAISLELAWAGVRLEGWVDLHGRLFPGRVLLFSYNQPSSVYSPWYLGGAAVILL